MARGFSGVRTSTLSEIADNLREIKDGQAAERDLSATLPDSSRRSGMGRPPMHTDLKGELVEIKGTLGDIKDILGEMRDTLRNMRAMEPSNEP